MTLALTAIIALLAGWLLGAGLRRRMPGAEETEPPAALTSQMDGDDAFSRLVAALPLGVVMVDAHSRITFANQAAATIFGFDLDRAVGRHVIAAVASLQLEQRVEDALRGEASVAPLVVAASGANRTYAVSTYPLPGRTHGSAGALVLADDQTEFVALERSRQDFMSNVSHELRTPLASIKLMLETVIESPDDEAADIFIPQALAQVDRLAALVSQLLDQARVQSGQLSLALGDIDLESVVSPIVASFEPQAAAKEVELSLQVLRPVRLEADPGRLAQVVVNLVDNALRHTPPGGQVRVELDAHANEALLRVRDTGAGIPYQDLPHIFERFYVVDRSRARELSGAGLGLSIVKQIVDAHGGRIAAESMLGSGATFTVRLPIMHAAREG